MFDIIANAGGNSTEGFCGVAVYLANSGCLDIQDEETCVANDQCMYEADSKGKKF